MKQRIYAAALVLWVAVLSASTTGCSDRGPSVFFCHDGSGELHPCELPDGDYMLMTSDVHLAAPQGRWPWTTVKFNDFLDEIAARPPGIFFVNGDHIDNFDREKAGEGDEEMRQRELRLFETARDKVDADYKQSYGPGHDWLNKEHLAELEERWGPARGRYSWKGLDVVWLSFDRASFVHSEKDYRNIMTDAEYEWLDEQLSGVDRGILAFHVPVLTFSTYKHGRRAGGRNYTIDPRDRLYEVIDEHSKQILAIFNGHVHKAVSDHYKDVPVYVCPFFDHGGFCTIEAGDDLQVTRYHYIDESKQE